MALDNITLNGVAKPSQADVFTFVPFMVSFTLDTSSGTQTYTPCGEIPVCAFDVSGLVITNLSGSVNGQALDMGPAISGGAGWGTTGTMFSTLGFGNFVWEFDEHTAGVQPNLESIINHAPFNYGSFTPQWDVMVTGMSMNPVSIPEPDMWVLFIVPFALIALGFLKGYRYGT